jgi:hypothetical protein
MDAFRVWINPQDYEFLVCVDGVENARWLLDQLAGSFVFRSAQPINQSKGSTLCTFQVPCNPLLTFSRFQKLLTAIPEVTFSKLAAVID